MDSVLDLRGFNFLQKIEFKSFTLSGTVTASVHNRALYAAHNPAPLVNDVDTRMIWPIGSGYVSFCSGSPLKDCRESLPMVGSLKARMFCLENSPSPSDWSSFAVGNTT